MITETHVQEIARKFEYRPFMNQLTVYIEYRIDAGPSTLPSWNALRARVRMGEGTQGSPYLYGCDLIEPKSSNIRDVVNRCIAHRKMLLAKRLRFEFAPLLKTEPEAYEWFDGKGWVSC